MIDRLDRLSLERNFITHSVALAGISGREINVRYMHGEMTSEIGEISLEKLVQVTSDIVQLSGEMFDFMNSAFGQFGPILLRTRERD